MIIVQILVLFVIIATLFNFFLKRKNKRFYKLLEKIPTHPTYPLIGNAHLLLGSSDGFLARMEKITKPFERMVYWLGPIPILFVRKHDDIATILSQSTHRETLDALDEWVGTGLLTAPIEEWKKSRRLLTHAFSSNMLSKYMQVFNKNALNFVEKLKPVAESGQEIDISSWITTASLGSILENSTGISIQKGVKSQDDFSFAVVEAMRDVAKRFQWPLLLFHNVYMIYLKLTGRLEIINNLHSLPTKLVRGNLKEALDFESLNVEPINAEDSSKTMLDLLIKKRLEETSFTETRIRNELLQLIIGGTETLSLNVKFLMLMLAMHQDIQQKVYEEIMQLETEDNILTPNLANNNLPYLDQCIKETLRMFSPILITSRRVDHDIILKDKTVIPAKTYVAALLHLANYDPDLYENPNKWDPEHFNEEAIKERPKTSQLSFGFGPRYCIGAKYAMMSVKTLISHILRNYHLSTSVKEFTKHNLKGDLGIRSKIGYPVKFTTRQKMRPVENN